MTTLILPPTLADSPFSVSSGRAAGMSSGQLRSPYLHIPTRGARVLDEPVGAVERAHTFSVALPADTAFSHVTALALWSLWLPRRAHESTIHVMRDTTRARIRRAGCTGHRGLEQRVVERAEGLRTVAPLDTWCDLGELVPAELSFGDLLVVGDSIANRLPEGDPTQVFSDALARRVRTRGAATLRTALALIRRGSRSPMESLTRLLFIHAGFPEPRLNVTVSDDDGGWLLLGDLVWDEERVVVEYQGSTHADRQARSQDADRASVARDHGAQVFEVFAEDLFETHRRQRLLVRVARALKLDLGSLNFT
ncbi:MAG: hypothetical protein HY829_14035 [Actinobacteria bacterium]|nr:hypothetical protein [Actinomycetota bacterium]